MFVISVEPPANYSDRPVSQSTPNQTISKSFKMLRLRKGPEEELGIIISKKRNANKGTTGRGGRNCTIILNFPDKKPSDDNLP